MAELNVAVVGCGGIGKVHLARWANVSGAQIAAVCDVDAATATQTATKYGAEAHTEWRELVDRQGLDAIDICTPPNQHPDQVIQGARAGERHGIAEREIFRHPRNHARQGCDRKN